MFSWCWCGRSFSLCSDCAADEKLRGMMLNLLFRVNMSIPYKFLLLLHQQNLHHLLHPYQILTLLILHQPCSHLPQHNPPLPHCCHRPPLLFSIHPSTWHHPFSQGCLRWTTLHPAGWSPVYWGTVLLNTAASCRPAGRRSTPACPNPRGVRSSQPETR